jgi:Gas vesicle synthesis protein GvpL/GvpF
VNRAPDDAPTDQVLAAAAGQGWYLYGVTEGVLPDSADGSIAQLVGMEDQPVSTIVVGDLAAVITPVSVENYSPEALSARAGDAAWLEAMVRGHNDVIDAVHAQTAILPAKFGSVYGQIEDLRQALRPAEQALRDQLARVQGTDEWAVHIYADRAAIEDEVAAHDSNVLSLRSQLAGARPGRAFFLQRKLSDELAAATDAALHQKAQQAHAQLGIYALDVDVSPAARSTDSATDTVEILRAAYLVRRVDTDDFLEAAGTLGNTHPGLEVEVTGPWPPYSFVSSVVGEEP